MKERKKERNEGTSEGNENYDCTLRVEERGEKQKRKGKEKEQSLKRSIPFCMYKLKERKKKKEINLP